MQKALACAVLISIVSIFAAVQACAEDLVHVEMVGLHNDKGKVACSIFASGDGFPSHADKAVNKMAVPIKDKKAVCDFKGLAKGTYAVSVFHDEDSSGKLEYNDMGIPAEGVGASRDAKGVMGPPKFDDAKFDYPGGRKDLTVHMDYLLEPK